MNRPTPDKPDHGAYHGQRQRVTQSDLSEFPDIRPEVCRYCSRMTALPSRISPSATICSAAKRQLQHLDGFIIHPAAAGGSLRVAVLGDKEMHYLGDAPGDINSSNSFLTSPTS